MKATPINDFMTTNGTIRADGRVVRDPYLHDQEAVRIPLVATVPTDQSIRR